MLVSKTLSKWTMTWWSDDIINARIIHIDRAVWCILVLYTSLPPLLISIWDVWFFSKSGKLLEKAILPCWSIPGRLSSSCDLHRKSFSLFFPPVRLSLTKHSTGGNLSLTKYKSMGNYQLSWHKMEPVSRCKKIISLKIAWKPVRERRMGGLA